MSNCKRFSAAGSRTVWTQSWRPFHPNPAYMVPVTWNRMLLHAALPLVLLLGACLRPVLLDAWRVFAKGATNEPADAQANSKEKTETAARRPERQDAGDPQRSGDPSA